MPELVVLDLPGGPDFVDALQRVWDAGDAAFPLDPRLPQPEAERVIRSLSPGAVIERDGERRQLEGGVPTRAGDAVVVATSGTTGRPKGVVHTHRSITASANATSEALEVEPTSDCWLACLPLAHIGGLAVVMRSLITGTPVIVHDGFDPVRCEAAAGAGATLTSLVTRALNQVDTTLFRTILIGGAAPPPERPANVIATYGMTETGSGCVYDRVPLAGLEIAIADDSEILLRGDLLLRCYRGGDGESATREQDPKSADGWFATGDLGGWGDDGLIQVHGRAGDVIITGGEKVWPARVEPLIAAQAGVAEAALVGRAHPDWGHEVVALVVASDPAAPPTLEPIREAVRSQLPAWYAPRRIEVVPSLPKTTLGKIRRDLL